MHRARTLRRIAPAALLAVAAVVGAPSHAWAQG